MRPAAARQPTRKESPTSRRERATGGRLPVRGLTLLPIVVLSILLAGAVSVPPPPEAFAAVSSSVRGAGPQTRAAPSSRGGSSLESAAARAGDTGRAVAMSLIGLAFAVAATVLAFRRDFKEAAGVFAVGIVSVLLATPTGVSLLRDTVSSLFGA